MLKDWDSFERLPEIDQMLLLEALMSMAMVMIRIGEGCWIAERIIADPRCHMWAHDPGINERMSNKPKLSFDLLINAIAEEARKQSNLGN